MVQPSYPGIYVQEKSSGPGPITGVSTSNMGLVGFTTRGRINYPVLCTSYADFVSKFGTFTGSGLAPTMAYAFFANGGQRMYMVRTVHFDALYASKYWYKSVVAETLTSVAQPTGHYAMDTNKVPIVATVPGSVRVEFQHAATNNIFEDNGLGVMAFVPVGSGGSGGSGSIDYETGEITIQLNVAADFTGAGGKKVVATYDYKEATFRMRWPGVAGNLFRVKVVGSPDYYVQATAHYTAFKITVEEAVTVSGSTVWQVNETFDEVVLDDATDPKYFKTIMNDSRKGSQYVEVIDYGNAQDIADLAGVSVTNEDFSSTQVPAYDGTTKQFVYTMANAVAAGTLEARFKFKEIGFQIGVGDGTAAPACVPLGYHIVLGGGLASTYKVKLRLHLSIAGWVDLYDDGAGNLRTSPFPGTIHATVNYVTGAVTVTAAGGNMVVASSAIAITCEYRDEVTVVDDGNGAMSVQAPAAGTDPPTKFQLNSSGTNTIDYDSGDMTLTWKVVGNPALGPAGVAAVTADTPATKTGAVEPYALTSGDHFDLDVNNAGAAAVTFTGTVSSIETTNAWPTADNNGKTIIFDIDGTPQTVLFAGATTTEAHHMNQINAQLIGASAYDVAGNIHVKSDTKGLGSVCNVTGGTYVDVVFAATVPGAGNVQNIAAVTADEVKTATNLVWPAVATVVGGAWVFTSTSTGPASELDLGAPGGAGHVITALGMIKEVIIGATGAVTGGELADYYTQPDDSEIYVLAGGSDGAATTRADVTAATLEAASEGMYALSRADEIMQVVIADFQTDDSVCRDVITYCENMGDKFGLFTIPEGLDEQEAVNWRKFTLAQYSNKVAAPYYPHIRITDPVTDATINIPDGGHIAGIYAKCDNNKNVGKAPAGVEDGKLLWLEGLEADLTRPQVGYCDQNKINCLVSWPQTGMAVWGNATLEAPGGEFLEVQQRRLFQFVEKSVFNSTHIHVFANNGPALWAAITLQVTNFLLVLFHAGYMAGTTPDEAFFVICDSTNNDDTTNMVYCDIGLKTNRAAKFIIFTFSQMVL
jgi:phage tail sheath protein FI